MALHPLLKPRANDSHKRLSTHQLHFYSIARLPFLLHEVSKELELLLLRYRCGRLMHAILWHGPREKFANLQRWGVVTL